MRILLIVAVLVCIGCGELESAYIDPELRPYLDDYISECERRPECAARYKYELDGMVFVDAIDESDPEIIGQCVISFFGLSLHSLSALHSGRIQIDRQTATQLGPYSWRALIYHELGHCIHGLAHSEEQLIMRPYIASEDDLSTNWPLALDQLMGPLATSD